MNNTLQELIGLILSLKEANPFLQVLTSTSKTAVWRNILETVAFMIFNFQEALRLHMKEIDEKIANQNCKDYSSLLFSPFPLPHRFLPWRYSFL